MQVFISHPELDGQETRLSSDVLASATSSTVENNKGFSTNDYVVFGTLGEELTEIVKLTGTTGTTTLGHTTGPVFAHSARTSISQVRYNQVKVYSSTSETGTYSLVGTKDLSLDQDGTVYEDDAGTESTWYKIKYYNSTTTVLSSFSVAVQGTGYTENSLKSMGDEILEDFGDPEGKDLKREQVYNYLRGGVRKVVSEMVKMLPDYNKCYAVKALTSGSSTLPTRFLGFIRVDVGSTADDAHKAEYVDEGSLIPDSDYSESSPKVFIRGSSFYTLPDTSANAYVWYWEYPAPMTTDSSEHGLPYGARDVLVNYALYRAWLMKDPEKAVSFKSLYRDSLSEYVDFVAQSRQQISSNHVEVKSGSDLYEY
jgi:hypothetical protein